MRKLNAEEKAQSHKARLTWCQEWRDKHRKDIVTYNRTYQDKYPERIMWRSSKTNSVKRGLEHTITEQDIIIPDCCPVLGTPFYKGTPYAASLDRIDSGQGYIPGNVQVISRKANTMKLDATDAELRKFAEWVLA